MIGAIFDPLEEVQAHVELMLKHARESDDKSMGEAMMVSEYPDHVVVGVVLALHYATNNREPITRENVFNAILFLDKLDTVNLKVTGK